MCFPLSWQLDTMLTMQLGMIPAVPEVVQNNGTVVRFWSLVGGVFFESLETTRNQWILGMIFFHVPNAPETSYILVTRCHTPKEVLHSQEIKECPWRNIIHHNIGKNIEMLLFIIIFLISNGIIYSL